MKKVTINSVASHAVSKNRIGVLNNSQCQCSYTRKVSGIYELDYTPNPIARGLQTCQLLVALHNQVKVILPGKQ